MTTSERRKEGTQLTCPQSGLMCVCVCVCIGVCVCVQMVMLLGDFNADCGYVAKKNRMKVRLYSDPSFLWMIGDKEDTTVRISTSCTYDRLVHTYDRLVHT